MMTVREHIHANGGPNHMAAQLGVTPTALRKWYQTGVVPLNRCARFCELTGATPLEANPALKFAVEYGRQQAAA